MFKAPNNIIFPKREGWGFINNRLTHSGNITWDESIIKVITHNNYYFGKIDVSIYIEIENKIKTLLKKYDPLYPIDFFDQNFHQILGLCLQKNF